MKGIIFNLLEEVVVADHGDDAWDALLDDTGLDGVYTAVGSYPDEEFVLILSHMPATLDRSMDGLLRWFGRKSIPLLAQRYPVFFDGHTTTRSFLLTLNDIIHPEVRKLYPDADVPEFSFATNGDSSLVVGYRSRRQLCALAEGFIEGAADFYGETVTLEQPRCMHRGDPTCDIACRFE
jgi:hypothetical protein